MVYRLLFTCGAWTVGIATALYVSTWVIMAAQPSRVLLGGVESFWLKLLIRAAYAGIFIIVLGALDAVTADLFLRGH